MNPSCRECHGELVDDGKSRKRLRQRRCKSCKEATTKQKDPVKVLSHRFNVALQRLFRGKAEPKHWSVETVQHVLKRFDSKSCISGEGNLDLLCLFPYDQLERPPEVDEIVLVTSREAQSISRAKSSEERRSSFPLHVQHLMEQN